MLTKYIAGSIKVVWAIVVMVLLIIVVCNTAHAATHSVAIEWTTDSSLVAKMDSVKAVRDTVTGIVEREYVYTDSMTGEWHGNCIRIVDTLLVPRRIIGIVENTLYPDSVWIGDRVGAITTTEWRTAVWVKNPVVRKGLILYESEGE